MRQTYQNIEIIIVDDCSTDTSMTVAEDYGHRFQCVRAFRNEETLGLVRNWNQCLSHASGEWIKFVFQDDWLEKDCIEKFMSHKRPGIKLIVSQRSYFLCGDIGQRTAQYYRRHVQTFESLGVKPGNGFVDAATISSLAVRNMGLNFIAEPSLTLIERSVFSEVGLFNADLAQLCDLEFMLRVAANQGLVIIPEKLCHLRVHPHSVSLSDSASLRFSRRHLDPIILAWGFLFSSHYSNLRASLSHGQRRWLERYFAVRCHEAALTAEGSPEAMRAFDEIALKYREIGDARKGSLATWILLGLVKARRALRHLYVFFQYLPWRQ